MIPFILRTFNKRLINHGKLFHFETNLGLSSSSYFPKSSIKQDSKCIKNLEFSLLSNKFYGLFTQIYSISYINSIINVMTSLSFNSLFNLKNTYKCKSESQKKEDKNTEKKKKPNPPEREDHIENEIDELFDIYKRFMKKSLSGNKKSNDKSSSTKSSDEDNNDKKDGSSKNPRFFSPFFLFMNLVAFYYMAIFLAKSGGLQIDYEFSRTTWDKFVENYLITGNISKIVVSGENDITVLPRNGSIISLSVPSKEYFIKKLEEAATEHNYNITNIPIVYKPQKPQDNSSGLKYLFYAVMILSFLSAMKSLSRIAKVDKNSIFKMMNPNFEVKSYKKSKLSDVKFNDVKGCDEAKLEIQEFVEFLKNPEHFKKLGARIPRGAILHGPPGTGKTLLAKAVAGEANVPFFFASGSEFIEMFVGVGASRVRDLFSNARAESPSIIFIDEIDAIGSSRSSSRRMGHMESDQTLNQLLVELDGFTTDTNIVVLCGTNRYDQLDKALIRPGRLDRKIFLAPPDFKGRKELFAHYLSKVTVDSKYIEEYSSRLSGLTPGSTGADICSIVNEGAILAARENQTTISLKAFESSIDRLILGNKLSKNLTPGEKNTVAIHESGHAVVSWFLKNTQPILKVSIVPRGRALGVNQFLPSEDFLMSKEDIVDMMAAILGGRAAEEIIIGSVSTGASDDLLKVTELAYKQVGIYGMDEEIGNLAFASVNNKFKGELSGYAISSEYSSDLGNKIDQKVHAMVHKAYSTAKKLITEKKDLLSKLAEELKVKEVLSSSELEYILGPRPFGSRTVASVMNDSSTSSTQPVEKE